MMLRTRFERARIAPLVLKTSALDHSATAARFFNVPRFDGSRRCVDLITGDDYCIYPHIFFFSNLIERIVYCDTFTMYK